MWQVGAVNDARKRPAFTWCDDAGVERKFKIDQPGRDGCKVAAARDLAGQAMRVALAVAVKVPGANVGQGYAIRQREGQRLILRAGHAMAEPGGHKGDCERDKQHQTVDAEHGRRQHGRVMDHDGGFVNRLVAAALRRIAPGDLRVGLRLPAAGRKVAPQSPAESPCPPLSRSLMATTIWS